MQINSAIQSAYNSDSIAGVAFPKAVSRPATSVSVASQLVTGANGTSAYDFTNMTPNQMIATIDQLSKSGRMTLNQSSTLVGTIPSPLTAVVGTTYDPSIMSKPINFMAGLQDELGRADNSKTASDIQSTISLLKQMQGSVASVNTVT